MSDFEFELENINATSDLVTFLPIRDCFSNEYRVRVLWDIGDSYEPDIWDYVGLYNTEWKSVNDHLAYKWAPIAPHHAFSLRRRSVHFTDIDFDHVRMPGVDFQFLYVANGEHVVGISNTFQFRGSIGYEDDLCFDIAEGLATVKPPVQTESRKRQSIQDGVNLVREFQLCSPSKRRTVKEKVLTVFRDHDTLSCDFTAGSSWKDALHIVQPVVKEYKQDADLSVVPYTPVFPNDLSAYKTNSAQAAANDKEKELKKKLIYDVKNQTRATDNQALMLNCAQAPKRLEFKIRLPLLPGPQSILDQLASGSNSCTFCCLSRVVITELLRREQQNEATIKNLKAAYASLKCQEHVVKKKKRHIRLFHGSKEELFYKKKIGDLLRKNHGLLKQARYWKNECLLSRSEVRNCKLPKIKQPGNSEDGKEDQDQKTQTSDNTILESIRTLTESETANNGCNTMGSECSTTLEEEEDGWKTQKPKRIARLHLVISQQSQTIQTINKTVSQQREAIVRQNKEIADLRKLLSDEQKDNASAKEKLTEMTERVKSILHVRSKEKSVEWRQFARMISAESFQEIRPSGAATSRNNDSTPKTQNAFAGVNSTSVAMASSGSQRYPGKSERVCPTCDMVFSPSVDPHVIEEHIIFHQVYSKKVHAD